MQDPDQMPCSVASTLFANVAFLGTHGIDWGLYAFYNMGIFAGPGGSVGCAVRLENRRSRVQPPPRSVTFFRED